MNEILILFLILGTLFIIENKSINLLAYYVGMVIIIAILISIYPNLNEIQEYWNGVSYISYILVLVQISALTILFGFIIMLFPKNNTDILIKQKNKFLNIEKTKENNIYKYILLLISLLISSLLIYIYKDEYEDISEIFFSDQLFNYFDLTGLFEEEEKFSLENNLIMDLNNDLPHFINKISYLLYAEPSNIFKFIIITIILLFAIICLFFILFPTI